MDPFAERAAEPGDQGYRRIAEPLAQAVGAADAAQPRYGRSRPRRAIESDAADTVIQISSR
jgi:hypothetical protein